MTDTRLRQDGGCGLVLTGGGARAAYQAGVLRGLAETLGGGPCPFSVLTGISAGAINAAFLASYPDDFDQATARLCDLWDHIRPEHVMRTDVAALGALSARWARDLGFGGLLGGSHSTYLLDTAPLRVLLDRHLDAERMFTAATAGPLSGIAISATNYATGTAVSFYEGAPTIEPWARSSRIGLRARITLEHVLASAAIPLLFAPVKISGSYYGDGGIRLSSPLSPAIHLGASRVLAIGIRYQREAAAMHAFNEKQQMKSITLADIAGVMLNAAFLDTLDADAERMLRINETVRLLSHERLAEHPSPQVSRLREVPLHVMRPSLDLGTLASGQFDRFPGMLRYLLRGIGASGRRGWDLLSYLAFDGAYTSQLVALGRKDALKQGPSLATFLHPARSALPT